MAAAGTGPGGPRFVVSPLRETCHSLWTLRDPGRYPHQLPWLRRLRRLTPRPDAALLVALTGDGHRLPRFLTALPPTPAPDLPAELAAVRRAEPATVVRDIAAVYRDGPPPAVLGDDATHLRDRLADALESYWTTVMEPHWRRLRGVLEADVRYRGRVLAERGTPALVASLHRQGEEPYRPRTDADAVLCPSVFAHRVTVAEEETLQITYPARGAATVWDDVTPPTAEALTGLIGRPKTTILTTLSVPGTTGALARAMGVSPSAVSQHLARLTACGLVTRRKEGRTVLYLRSELGDRLVGG
ncbi:helix-turn-helix domain-containing protein [Streptomyces sp. CRN 30]|uniref:helix-turn-helix domain-containing protein n=1 Tax=Streptomyces sp. CRN 30 TaxID=3075613 RepID=UPI002A8079AF|nr:helix-turn-helix domain-containing protein [Streptomyces sp. CRN 30]